MYSLVCVPQLEQYRNDIRSFLDEHGQGRDGGARGGREVGVEGEGGHLLRDQQMTALVDLLAGARSIGPVLHGLNEVGTFEEAAGDGWGQGASVAPQHRAMMDVDVEVADELPLFAAVSGVAGGIGSRNHDAHAHGIEHAFASDNSPANRAATGQDSNATRHDLIATGHDSNTTGHDSATTGHDSNATAIDAECEGSGSGGGGGAGSPREGAGSPSAAAPASPGGGLPLLETNRSESICPTAATLDCLSTVHGRMGAGMGGGAGGNGRGMATKEAQDLLHAARARREKAEAEVGYARDCMHARTNILYTLI